MYSVASFGAMAADGLRMDAYSRAIGRLVKDDSVVVDIGSGTGIFALLALAAGARVVHAIDPNPAIWLARDLAAENALGDRLVVHDRSSFDVELPERAHVVISDLRGSFPLYDRHLATLEDAKRRLLAPEGVMLPARDGLMAALVESERFWRDIERGWTGIERHGFTAKAARTSTLNTRYDDAETPIHTNDVLTIPRRWAEIRYGEAPPAMVEGTVELPVTRAGVAHAIAVWFEATLHDDIAYANSPGSRVVYARTLLPLLEPVTVAHGASAALTLRVDPTGERWAWDTAFRDGPRFRQTTFFGAPTSAASLLRESSSFAPVRGARGERTARVIAMMDGARTVEELTDALVKEDRTISRAAALEEVRSCVHRYAR